MNSENQKTQQVLQEIEKVVIGKNEVIEKILMAVLAAGHVLMEDVPGVGKTTTAMALPVCWGWKHGVSSLRRTPCRRTSSAFPSTIRKANALSTSPAPS